MKRTIALLLTILSITAQGQKVDNYEVGFRIISTYDSSRIYKPNTLSNDVLHFRPINVDLWYPAHSATADTTASFGDFVNLLEQRSNFYDDTRNYQGLSDELLQYFCAGSDCPDYRGLKKIKTNSYVNAKPIAQKFPLIVYLSAYNGMCYENYSLLEKLANKGFVVASISSIGRYPGNMTMDSLDLFEQVNDAIFTINHLIKGEVVSNHVGLIGYSWGGLAASALSMVVPKNINIMATVSLDGSEQFYYGDEEEDRKLTLIRKSSWFKPEYIQSAYLHLDSDMAMDETPPDSLYNITKFIQNEKHYFRIKQATHEDFSCLSQLATTKDKASNSQYQIIESLAVNFLLDKIKDQEVFRKNIPVEHITTALPLLSESIEHNNSRYLMTGLIRDRQSNKPLAYVNVGIINKDKGTTTNVKGQFEIDLSKSNKDDTLSISLVGYESILLSIQEIIKRSNSNLSIFMEEKTSELKEVVVQTNPLTTKVLGNKSESKFFGGKFGSKDLGSEIAIKVKIKKLPTYLENFSFNLSYNTEDTTIFRVNIYDTKDGLPDKNILTENIILGIGKQTGKINLDLSKYGIVVDHDFFISLEWVDGNQTSGIVFSAGFINGGAYYRKASQGIWRKQPMGVGFNVTTKY